MCSMTGGEDSRCTVGGAGGGSSKSGSGSACGGGAGSRGRQRWQPVVLKGRTPGCRLLVVVSSTMVCVLLA